MMCGHPFTSSDTETFHACHLSDFLCLQNCPEFSPPSPAAARFKLHPSVCSAAAATAARGSFCHSAKLSSDSIGAHEVGTTSDRQVEEREEEEREEEEREVEERSDALS